MSINVVHGVYGMTFWGHNVPTSKHVLRQTSPTDWLSKQRWMRLIPIRSLSVWLFAFFGLIWELQSPGNWFWKLIWRELPLLSHLPLYTPALHSHSPTRSEMMWNVLHIFCDWEARVEVQKSKKPLWPKECRGRLASGESVIKSQLWMILADQNLIIFVDMGVSEIMGTPKSSILIGFSIINHRFLGYRYFWKHPYLVITQITYIVEVQKCPIVQTETGHFFWLCKDSRSFPVSWSEFQSPWEELAVVQREIGQVSQKTPRRRPENVRTCQEVRKRAPKFIHHVKPNISFLANACQVCLSAAFDAHQRKCAMSMSPLFWLQVIVKPSCWTMHNARLRPRYAHSLAERHNLVHATRQNEAGQTCPLLPSSIATQTGDWIEHKYCLKLLSWSRRYVFLSKCRSNQVAGSRKKVRQSHACAEVLQILFVFSRDPSWLFMIHQSLRARHSPWTFAARASVELVVLAVLPSSGSGTAQCINGMPGQCSLHQEALVMPSQQSSWKFGEVLPVAN